jgi:hypothetical protein
MATKHEVITTDEQIDRAIARASRIATQPRALAIEYDPRLDLFILQLSNGERLVLQRELLQGLEQGSVTQLSHVEITPAGTGLHWPDLDVDLYIPNLRDHVYGSESWMAQIGRRGGAAKSAAKTSSSRENGKLGGRPKSRPSTHSSTTVSRVKKGTAHQRPAESRAGDASGETKRKRNDTSGPSGTRRRRS